MEAAMAAEAPERIGTLDIDLFALRCAEVGYDMLTVNADFSINSIFTGRRDLVCAFARRELLVEKERALTSMKAPMLAELMKEVAIKKSYKGNSWRVKNGIIEKSHMFIHYASMSERTAWGQHVYIMIDELPTEEMTEETQTLVRALEDLSVCRNDDDWNVYNTIVSSYAGKLNDAKIVRSIFRHFMSKNYIFRNGWRIAHKGKLYSIPNLNRFFISNANPLSHMRLWE